MINVSDAFKQKLQDGERVWQEVEITFPDGTVKTVKNEIMGENCTFSDCAESSSFPIGCVVCKSMTLELDNTSDQWKNYNFYMAKVHAYLKMQTSVASSATTDELLDENYEPILDQSGGAILGTKAATEDRVETIDKGIYTITTPEQYGEILSFTALDDMYKTNATYISHLVLPQSIETLVRDACETLGIPSEVSMAHGNLIVSEIPENMTFRQLFGWAAMLETANARLDIRGYLRFIRWDFSNVQEDYNAVVDDDGNVTFKGGASIDSESFISPTGNWTIDSDGFLTLIESVADTSEKLKDFFTSPTVSSDDIVITGIKVTNGQSNDDTDTDYSGMYGEEGYVLELENELIDTDQLQTVANIIGEQIVGARFRNLEGDLVYNPLVEFGDMVYTYDRLGNKYLTPLTDVSGNVGGLTTVKTQADDPIRGSSDFYGNSTKAIVAARQMVRKETSAREEAIRRLAEALNSSSGLYMTQEPQQDGSIIYYMHNKATIAESNIIWKLTAEAFAVSIDGGKTYPYGFAVTGELITRLLYAEGINADYINAGTLIVRDKSGNAIFEADMDTGSVTLDGSCVTIGGKPLDEKIEDVENMAALARNMTIQLDNDYQGIPVDSDGNYTEFPECTTTATVMYGTQDITDNCTYTITTSQNIQGSWNKETKTYTVTGLTADSGWVNIKAAYLNNLVISKQFSLAKQYAGPQGIPGVGTDGKTTYLHIRYAPVQNPTAAQMSKTPNKYIGTYTDFSGVDSTDPSKYTWAKFEGDQGAQGPKGADGKTPYFHIAYANSADGRTGFSVDDSVNKLYIGQYTDYTPNDSTDPTKYSWTKIKGEQGNAGRTYFFQSNADVLLMGADKKITPAPLIVDSFYRDGNGEIAQTQKGWWKLEKSTDNGATWSALTVSQTAALDRLSINVNNLSLKAHNMLKVSLYFDQAKTKLADYQTFSVAVDVASLTQEQIVDILSDNGKFKGLYYEKDESGNTTLYISFNAMKGGVISLGGVNNGNGQLKIYDENGNLVSRLGYTGYVALNKNTGNPMVSLNTAGLRLYTDYTDAKNYKALMLGKYGLYAQDVSDGVIRLWQEGTGDGYVVKYQNDTIRIYTDYLTAMSDVTVKGTTALKDAYVTGKFTFKDYGVEDSGQNIRRRPVASVTNATNRVAHLSSSVESGKAALTISAQWGSTNYSLRKLYNDSASDVRLKKNFEDCEVNALDAVCKMPVCSFDWKENGVHQPLGLVADDLEKIDSLLALGGGYNEDGSINAKQIDRLLLTEYAIKAIQELSAKVDEQEKRIKELERRLQ